MKLINSYTGTQNYVGTSKGMEGEGIARICQEIMKDGYKLASIVHDNDASTMAQIKEYFPNCTEKLDVGHAAKNICKKVKEVARNRVKELLGFGERIKRRLQDLIHSSKGDANKFSEGLDNSIRHWSGNHSGCDHEELEGKFKQCL